MTSAEINLAIAQLEREGLLVSRIGPSGVRRWRAITDADDAKRTGAARARRAWKAAGCPEYDEEDLPLFASGAEAI